MTVKKLVAIAIGSAFLGAAGVAVFLIVLSSKLPQLVTVEDYKPLVVSEVFDSHGEKVGEFFREKRRVVTFEEIPKNLVNAFMAAEDASFYSHGGINYIAIFRALIANIKAGRKVQGGSTITQQVARSLLLTPEKTYIRKIREVLLAYKMEANLSKEEILYLYLNQIYLGAGAYGVATASEVYFRKPLEELALEEMAILAGLPQAPSRYSPIRNPSAAKARQRYVLSRMAEEDFITEEEAEEAVNKDVTVYLRIDYKELAPYYVETVRQYLVKALGESAVLDEGIRVTTAMDLKKQEAAQKALEEGLRELDKRQGFRGPIKNLTDPQEIAEFLLETRNELMDDKRPVRIIMPDGTIDEKGPLDLTKYAVLPEEEMKALVERSKEFWEKQKLAAEAAEAMAASGKEPEEKDDDEPEITAEMAGVRPLDEDGNPRNLPDYIEPGMIVRAVVTKVDDKWGLTYVRFAESNGIIDMDTMKWAGEPNPDTRWDYREIDRPSKALKNGDIIEVRIKAERAYFTRVNKELRELRSKMGSKYERPEEIPEDFRQYVEVELEQEPVAQAALVSFDVETEDIVAMVGGYDFGKSQFNRAIQALRQAGSSFKPVVYASAFDKGYKPNTTIIDAPVIYEQDTTVEDQEGQTGNLDIEAWKPGNYSSKFGGDILLRNALKQSKNIPTIKILDDIGVRWTAEYTKRLGVFNPINMDLSLGLGSSSLTLYEMTKVFAHFARLGKKIKPLLIKKVESAAGETLIENVSLDMRFEELISELETEFEEKRLRFLGKYIPPDGERIEGQNEEAPEPVEVNDPLADIAAAEGLSEEEQNRKLETSKYPPLYFDDPEQILKPETAYLTTSLLHAVIHEPGGTGGRARALGREAAGKTGTTSGYFDAWFIGYTPQITTGVWVGFDDEKTLGFGETGGSAALPIWLEYMEDAHEGLPKRDFPVPNGIVFANIDNETGYLASASSAEVVRQAFLDGTEPKARTETAEPEDENVDFYKRDLSQ